MKKTAPIIHSVFLLNLCPGTHSGQMVSFEKKGIILPSLNFALQLPTNLFNLVNSVPLSNTDENK